MFLRSQFDGGSFAGAALSLLLGVLGAEVFGDIGIGRNSRLAGGFVDYVFEVVSSNNLENFLIIPPRVQDYTFV